MSAPHLVLLAPDRLFTPRNPPPAPAPTVAVRLVRDASSPSGWGRKRITQAEVDRARPEDVVRSWDAWDPTSHLHDERGLVILDGVGVR